MERLEHRINKNVLILTTEKVKRDSDHYLELNDTLLRINRSSRGWGTLLSGVFVILLSLFFFIGAYIGFKATEDGLILLIMAIIFLTIGVFLVLYGCVGPEKEVVLTRMEGLITIPRFMWTKPVTFPFEEAEAFKKYYSSSPGVIASLLGIRHKKNKSHGGRIVHHYIEETWCLFVWYMDKNRPLPPGTAFDPYRQQDFERRKAEGFPRPLYPSSIATPEATPEQQKEREQHWSDFSEVKHQNK